MRTDLGITRWLRGKVWVSACHLLLLVVIASSLANAHEVVVKRVSNLRELPNRVSDVLLKLNPGNRAKLLEHSPKNGYYHVFLREANGWVWGRNVSIRQEYVRADWKHWIDEDGDCQDTRAEVLIAESSVSVTFQDGNKCKKVVAGQWADPYSGSVFTVAKDVDVDHMVPLKNAHVSGGWLWTWARRREYANDLSAPDHLIAVSNSLNRSKGHRGPDGWKPPNKSYWCEYARNWEKIKLRWDLSMTPAEREAVEEMKGTCD